MRFIHTSDWHLGQVLHQFDRTFEHQCFLDWLVETLVNAQIDALLISGDIFDTSNPSSNSQKQFYRFLKTAKSHLPHLTIVITAGNHDSPGRLEAPGPLLETLDAHVVGFVPRLADGHIDISRCVVPLKNKAGEVSAWCLAIPFLRPGDVPREDPRENLSEEAVDNAGDPYLQGIALLYRQALAHAQTLRQPGQAVIAMGHCHMVGGKSSEDSERRIVIGGTEALSATMFDASVSYAALGHLHLAQTVAQQNHLRYCGSPLPLSFAEVDYKHQVLCVELVDGAVHKVSALLVPRAFDLLRIPAKPAPLEDVLAALSALDLPNPDKPEQANDVQRHPYLEVRVRLDAPEPALRSRIEAALEGKAVRLAKIETSFAPKAQAADGTPILPTSLDALERLQPDDIFQRLYRTKYQDDVPAALRAAFTELQLAADEVTP